MRNFYLILLLLFGVSSEAAECLQGLGSGSVCNASDFQLTKEAVDAPASCIEGELLPPITVRLHMTPTANTRYDIGFFSGDYGQLPIGGSSCTVDALVPLESGGDFDPLSGSGPYRDLDGNGCGDTLKSDGEIIKEFVLDKVLCLDSDHNGKLDIQYVLTWQQQARPNCDPTDPADLNPPNASKCLAAEGNLDEIDVLPQPVTTSIAVTKSASPTIATAPGEEIEYTISIENNGTQTVSVTALNDDIFGPITSEGSCSLPQTLKSGETYSCFFTKNVAGATGDIHTNTITATAVDAENNMAMDSDSATVIFVAGASSFIGDAVFNDLNGDGTRQLHEPGIGGVTVSLYAASDPSTAIDTDVTQADGSYGFEGYPAGDYLVGFDPHQLSLNKYVLTTGNDPMGVSLATDADTVRYADFGFAKARLKVVKSVDKPSVPAPGEPVTYSYTVTNTGPLPVIPTIFYDNRIGNLVVVSCAMPSVLEPREDFSCTVVWPISGVEGDTIDNTVLFAAYDAEGNFHTAYDSVRVVIEDVGNAVIGHGVWHDRNGNGAFDAGESGFNYVTLALSGSETNTTQTLFGGLYTFRHLSAGDYNVTVTDDLGILKDYVRTNGSGPYSTVLAAGEIDTAANFGYAHPSMSISKSADKAVIFEPGASVTFTLTVRNDGEVPLEVTRLEDSVFGELNASNSTCVLPQSLDVNATYSCTFTRDVNGSAGMTHNNTVVVTATDPDDGSHTASDNEGVRIIARVGGQGDIGYLVWNDANRNGSKDAGESGIAGVTVDLIQGGIVVDSTVTASDGTYGFLVSNGTYDVNVTDTNGILAGLELVSSTNPHSGIAIADNIYIAANFGYAAPLVRPSISVTKYGSTDSITGSAEVTFGVDVENTSSGDVVLTTLSDSIYGDLNGVGNCSTGVVIPAGTTYSCEFVQTVSGEAGQRHRNTVIAVAEDAYAQSALGAGSWLIVFDANGSVAVPSLSGEGRGLLMVLFALIGGIFLYRIGRRRPER